MQTTEVNNNKKTNDEQGADLLENAEDILAEAKQVNEKRAAEEEAAVLSSTGKHQNGWKKKPSLFSITSVTFGNREIRMQS